MHVHEPPLVHVAQTVVQNVAANGTPKKRILKPAALGYLRPLSMAQILVYTRTADHSAQLPYYAHTWPR